MRKKNLNEKAIETFNRLLAMSDEEFDVYFAQFEPSELPEIAKDFAVLEEYIVTSDKTKGQGGEW